MKKLIIALSVLALSITTVPAQAETKSLAIIDSYFDNASVCVALSGCSVNLASKPALISNPANHGNGMVEVAKRQSPSISLVTIRSANTTPTATNEMTTGDFIRALTWVDKNSSGIGAVSISRAFNGAKPCSANTAGTAEFGGVVVADQKVRSLIGSLLSKGIPVFAATGNKFGAPVDYPACILETKSVGVGSLNKAGLLVSSYSFDNSTDYFASASVYTYKSTVFGLIPNTTSAGNVAVAAKYVVGTLDSKIVNVLQ